MNGFFSKGKILIFSGGTGGRSRSRWARCSRCRGPGCRTGTTPCRPCRRRGSPPSRSPWPRRRPDRGGGRRGGPARPGARLGGPRAVAAVGTGGGPSRGDPDGRRDRLAQRRRRDRGRLLRGGPAVAAREGGIVRRGTHLAVRETGAVGMATVRTRASPPGTPRPPLICLRSFLRSRSESRSPKTMPCGVVGLVLEAAGEQAGAGERRPARRPSPWPVTRATSGRAQLTKAPG